MKTHPDRHSVTFGDWSYQAIAKHFHKILKHEAGVLEDHDPEELHQMRVGVRRLRSAIAGFEEAIALPPAIQEKAVGKIGKKLGILRDLDVMAETLRDRIAPQLPPPEQQSLCQGLNRLAQKRSHAFKQTQKLVKGDRYQGFKVTFEKWLTDPQYRAIADLPMTYILPDLLLPAIARLFLHPGWRVGSQLGDGDLTNPASIIALLREEETILHNLRKEAKRSRYTLEQFISLYGETYQVYLQGVERVQTVLGELQDCSVLAKFVQNNFDDEISHAMPTFAHHLTETRLRCWQDWQPLRSRFTNVGDRLALREILLYPLDGSSIANK